MNKKLIISIILTLLCMLLIFSFSNETQKKSDGLSKGLINNCIVTYEKITGNDVNNKKLVLKLNTPVRKTAHFTLYFILSFLIYNIIKFTGIKYKEMITISICFIYALSDEFHQVFINGRAGEFRDVFIDSCGAMFLILICIFIKIIKRYGVVINSERKVNKVG